MKVKILAVLFLIITACQLVPAQAVRVNNLLLPEDLVRCCDAIIVGHIENFCSHQCAVAAGEPCRHVAEMDIIVDKVLSGALTQKKISVSELNAINTPDESGNAETFKWQFEWISLKDQNGICGFEETPAELMKPNLWFLKRGKHFDRFHDRVSSQATWCPLGIQSAKLAPFYAALLSKHPEAAVKAIQKGDNLIGTSVAQYLYRLKSKRAGQPNLFLIQGYPQNLSSK
jgi:hypothetical protein